MYRARPAILMRYSSEIYQDSARLVNGPSWPVILSFRLSR